MTARPNAAAVIWKPLLIAEKAFRRLGVPELLADVASGVVYLNRVRPVSDALRAAPPTLKTVLEDHNIRWCASPGRRVN